MPSLLLAALLAGAAAPSADLSILDFGGRPDGVVNNQHAIMKAMAACAAAGGCTLHFPTGSPADRPKGPPPYHPWGPPPVAVYRTSAINLTSHLRLVLEDGVQLRGTEDFVANCGGRNRSSCDDLDSPSWPVLPNPAWPSRQNSAGDDAGPAKQAFIRGYNLTDVAIEGGGEVHGGGGWWWCVRMAASTVDPAKHETTGAHAPRWCASMVRAGLIPDLATVQGPHMIHLVGCRDVVITNITISNSPEWTIHLQYSNNVTIHHVNVFNPNNETIEAPNADGIDVDSSTNVHVHDSIFDVGDDALCCKSGSDFDGRAVGIPSQNVLFDDIEVRNGHGLTLGSEASGGMLNITYRGIFINSMGGPQAPGKRKRPGAVGSIHFKSGRGRGGHWENITWENIYGNGATGLFSFSEFHGTSLGPEPSTGPTNKTGTPTIKNLLIKDVLLTECAGPAVIQTLAEAPIENFVMTNVSWSTRRGATGGYECTGYNGTRLVTAMFATGSAVNLAPPLPRDCQLMPPGESSTSTTSRNSRSSSPESRFGDTGQRRIRRGSSMH